MASTTIVRKQRLRTLEKRFRSGMEEFYYTGMILKEIRDDELFKEDGFETWERYCRERWELSRTYVFDLIRTSVLREKLPMSASGEHKWSERSVRELTRIPDNKQAARVAAQVIKEVESTPGAKLSASRVQKHVDADLGVKRPKAKPVPEANGVDLVDYLSAKTGTVQGIHNVLKAVPDEGWTLLIDDNPQLVKRFATALERLASFLRKVEK
jgi:hypothetical protein